MSLINYNLGPNFNNYWVLFFLHSFSKFFVLILFLVWILSYSVLSLLVLVFRYKVNTNGVSLFMQKLVGTPLEAFRGTGGWGGGDQFFFVKKFWWSFFLGSNSLRVVVIPIPKIVKNLPRIYERLHCKGEPFVQTDRETHRQTQKSCYS